MALILASSSAIRRQMLDSAGVDYRALKPDFDEDAAKAHVSNPTELASELAAGKARSLAEEGWIIGSDSVVSVEGQLFSKPRDKLQAADHLRHFSGRTMHLTSAVALARNGSIDWQHSDTAELQVRRLSERFIADYLDAEWPDVGYCVGVFRMEGRGVQLFDAIDGDYFTILGMPLIPLLGALRERRLIAL